MSKFFRYLYLNTYAFLLLFCGIAVALIPLFRGSRWLLVPQIVLSLIFLKESLRLFSTWPDKKVKCKILMGRNKDEFRPDTFKVFMQAPCGRLLAKSVLKDLGIREKYRELLVYKPSFPEVIKRAFTPSETSIYINEDFK